MILPSVNRLLAIVLNARSIALDVCVVYTESQISLQVGEA